jgi:biopolymer transport protein ExbD
MNFRGASDRSKNSSIEIPTTSITDIIFLILIFLMVGSTFTTYNINSLNINLPKAKGETIQQVKNISISITKNREFSIEKEPVDPNLIPAKMKELYSKYPDANIIIEADKDALHGDVVYVMDESKKAGFNKLAIAAESEE